MNKNFFDILRDNFNINFNNQQKSAVSHIDGPGVVLAVPGAGKTTVLICRTANLIINHNVSPKNILSLTFSKASANDMKQRFNKMFGNNIKSNIHFSTIHSFAYKLLREYCYRNKINYKLIESKKTKVNKSMLLKDFYNKYNNSIINDDKLEELINTIGYVKNMMISPSDFDKYNNFDIKSFNKIFINYEEFKRKNNYVDFDDMLTLTYKILNSNNALLKKYKSIYKYIQVDEGQDTSKVQNEIIKLLSSPTNNLFVVADDDQSIYGFRGSSPEYLLNFDKIYKNAKTFFMEQNFRSSKNIVSVCNDFIKNNSLRYNKNLFTKRSINEPVKIIKLKDEYQQLEYLLKQLKSINKLDQTAILYRNNTSSISIIEMLSNNNIPFYTRDSKLHFFNHWILKDTIAFMNLALDNYDIQSFEKIYYKMNGYISKAALHYVKSNNLNQDIFDRLLKFPGFKSFQKENITRLKKDFKHISKKTPYDAIEFILYNLEYNNYLNKHCKRFGYSLQGTKTILSSLKVIASNTNTIIEFIAKLSMLKNIVKNSKNNKNCLRLSTIHSSKGLEFENVFMIDLIDGDFPSTSSIDLHEIGEIKPLEEERRLFYVGMTRARNKLSLITIKHRNNEKVFQSRFINELEKIVNCKNENSISQDHNFKVGNNVHHKKFGNGKVLSLKEGIITIKFKSKGIRKLSLKMITEKNILKTI